MNDVVKFYGGAILISISIVSTIVYFYGAREITPAQYSAVQEYVQKGEIAPAAVQDAMTDGKISISEYGYWRDLIFSKRYAERQATEATELDHNKKKLSETLSGWRNQ